MSGHVQLMQIYLNDPDEHNSGVLFVSLVHYVLFALCRLPHISKASYKPREHGGLKDPGLSVKYAIFLFGDRRQS